ncbi:MAG: glutamine amidotransferase [Hyphomicrobiaceae bacterium]|nr:MAG: glutamine amidotransferase [Hyphomicrobiaceae bacterium]
MKTAVVIRHVAFEDLGTFAPVLARAGFDARYVEAGIDDLASPELRTADLVVVLGGPIAAYDESIYPFLLPELRLLEHRLTTARPTLGICLGAQLIARAAGASVYAGRAKEIGYGPITPTSEGRSSCLAHLEQADWQVLHWHGDTFDLPAGARRLASTAITDNQAFAIGSHVLGLQFHMEADPRLLERWLIGHACELSAARIDISRLRSDARRYGAMVTKSGQEALGAWLTSAMSAAAS